MGQDDPIPAGYSGPPPPDYGAAGENKDDRAPPGGYLGDKKHKGGDTNGDHGGPGPVIPDKVEPDPTEPNYSADVWDYIHYAASRADSYPSEMSSRIRSGNVNAHTSITRYTPLHIAVKFGQCEAVRQLIAAGARIDLEDVLGETPLILSCCYEVGTDIPRMLLDAEANVEHVDKYTWTPLFWAAYKGRKKITKMLLDHGAKKNAKDKRGKTPYDVTTNHHIRKLLD